MGSIALIGWLLFGNTPAADLQLTNRMQATGCAPAFMLMRNNADEQVARGATATRRIPAPLRGNPERRLPRCLRLTNG